MHITFVIHGRVPRIEQLKQSIRSLFSKEYDFGFELTKEGEGAKMLVKTAYEKGSNVVVVAGGDGSLNEAANGYMALSEEIRKNALLGILPLGTGNDFAKSLGVNKDLNQLFQYIKNASYQKVDLGKMNFQGRSGKKESRYFINIADIGLGGIATEKVRKSSKILGSNFTYTKAILSTFLHYKKQVVALKSPGFEWEGKMLSLCMANGKYLASGLCVAPDARLDDGRMQLTIFGDLSIWDYLRNIAKLKRGDKVLHKEVIYASANQLNIVSKEEECPIDMDGEFVGFTPLEVEIQPLAVKMIA